MRRSLYLATLLCVSFVYGGGKGVVKATPEVAAIVPVANPSPWYVGVGLLWSGMRRDCACQNGNVEETTYGALLRAGYDFNQYVGVEVRGLYSNLQKDIASTEHYGLYLKPMYPVSESLNIYGLLGYGKTKIECFVESLSYDDNGLSWGVGLEYDLSSKKEDYQEGKYDRTFDGQGDQERGWGLWIDYQNLLSNASVSHFDSNIVSAGVTYDF
jgi:OOP family OmpA-OmpF porin